MDVSSVLDWIPSVASVVAVYVAVKVSLTKHDVKIESIEKTLDELTKEVRANNEVKLRTVKLEEEAKSFHKEIEWVKKLIEREGK